MARNTWIDNLKGQVRKLKQHLHVLYLSFRDPRIPWYAKIVAISVVAYAFSPIDLIPDFIPILGYLDDLVIVPLGIILALKLIPSLIIQEYKIKAEETRQNDKPKNWIMGVLFITIWISLAVWSGILIMRALG